MLFVSLGAILLCRSRGKIALAPHPPQPPQTPPCPQVPETDKTNKTHTSSIHTRFFPSVDPFSPPTMKSMALTKCTWQWIQACCRRLFGWSSFGWGRRRGWQWGRSGAPCRSRRCQGRRSQMLLIGWWIGGWWWPSSNPFYSLLLLQWASRR